MTTAVLQNENVSAEELLRNRGNGATTEPALMVNPIVSARIAGLRYVTDREAHDGTTTQQLPHEKAILEILRSHDKVEKRK